MKISGGASGTGAGTVSFSVDPNPPGGSARSSNIAVQGNNFKVTQDPGPPPPPSTLSANPNPITSCNSQGLGKTTITWSTAAPGTIQVRIGKIDGALFAGGSEGTQETGEFFSSPATIYLVQDGSIVLAQTTVTTACGVLLKPTGKLQASPNPLPICSPQTSGNVTLSWTTTDVTAVAIRRDTFNGTVATSGAASGSATVTVTPPATLLLVDASAGVTPTAERVLDRVTVTAGACTNQAGTAPPATDLAESITDWTMEFLAAGKNARGGSQTIDDKNFVVSGARSLYLYSDTADQIRLTRTIPGAGWDLSKSSGLEFTILSSVPAGFWKAGSPNIRLTSANGSLLIAPTSDVASLSAQNWLKLTAPIAGNPPWQASATGQFDPKNVTSIQISFE